MSPYYDDDEAELVFYLGYSTGPCTIMIDNVSLTVANYSAFVAPPAPEMVWNGDFSRAQNFWWYWSSSPTTVPDFSGGVFTLVNPNPGIKRTNMCIKSIDAKIVYAGTTYTISLIGHSSIANESIIVALSENGDDINDDGVLFTNLYTMPILLTLIDQRYSISFTNAYNSSNVSLNIFFTDTEGDIFIDDVSMKPE